MTTPTQHIDGWKAQTKYAIEYEHNGSRWGADFYAIDDADAEAKLKSMKSSLVLLGRIHGEKVLPDED